MLLQLPSPPLLTFSGLLGLRRCPPFAAGGRRRRSIRLFGLATATAARRRRRRRVRVSSPNGVTQFPVFHP